jgi:hypothetical protein
VPGDLHMCCVFDGDDSKGKASPQFLSAGGRSKRGCGVEGVRHGCRTQRMTTQRPTDVGGWGGASMPTSISLGYSWLGECFVLDGSGV